MLSQAHPVEPHEKPHEVVTCWQLRYQWAQAHLRDCLFLALDRSPQILYGREWINFGTVLVSRYIT